jgi:hypothetical protein
VTGPAGQAVLKDGDAYEYVVGEGEASNPKLTPLTTWMRRRSTSRSSTARKSSS